MKDIILAFEFLTRFHIPYLKFSRDSISIAKSSRYFSLVGIILGGIISLFFYLTSIYFPKIISSLFTVAFLLFICRAIHLDGFADTVDGIYGGGDREEILRIMRDSKIGVMAILALFFLLLSKIFLIKYIKEGIIYRSLILMPAMGRGSIVFGGYFSEYARSDFGLGKVFMEFVEKKELIINEIILIISLMYLLKFKGLIFYFLRIFISILFLLYTKIKIGGQTGDTLGALSEINEVCFLLGVYIILC